MKLYKCHLRSLGGELIGTEYLRAKLLHTVYEGVPGGVLTYTESVLEAL